MRTRAMPRGARAVLPGALLAAVLLSCAGCHSGSDGTAAGASPSASLSGSPSVSSGASVSGSPSVPVSGSPSPSPSGASAPPTEAGTDFRSATAIQQGEQATASASTGDYLYWMFPADTGQKVTVRATVTFPGTAVRQGTSTWQVDVYDGLRRRQPCTAGTQDAAAAAGSGSVRLSCTLRTIRAWAEPWSNDPLRGGYYVRLTAVDIPSTDVGLPVRTAVQVTSSGTGGAAAVDGSVAPLTSRYGADVLPSGGWSSSWWSDRWLWTGAGGALAALAAVGGYCLTRGAGRPRRVPQEAWPPRD